MRALAAPALAVALCACGREPSFDERYSQSENAIIERAQELDAELEASEVNEVAQGDATGDAK